MQKCANLVELEKCCQTHIYLRNFVLIQSRTSPPTICKKLIPIILLNSVRRFALRLCLRSHLFAPIPPTRRKKLESGRCSRSWVFCVLFWIFADSVSFRSFASWWTGAEIVRSVECHMRGLHAHFSDVHAFNVILKTCSTFCALCVMMLYFSASNTLCVDVTSTRSILINTSIRRGTRASLRSATNLTRYEIDSARYYQFEDARDRFCVIRFNRVNEQAQLWMYRYGWL